MTLRLISGFAMAAVAVVGFAVPSAMAKSAGGASAVRMMDTDSDGTVDMKEVQTMASATFDRLEKDSDTTLDSKELKGRLSKSGVKAADPDADGTLDKNEYLAAVAERFKMADPDGDGTLDAKELNSKAGKALIALIK